MIVGVGVDVVAVARVRALLSRWGDRFLQRTFTVGERSYALRRPDPGLHLAARLAAKEAAFKALASRSLPMGWRDVEILRSDGAPAVRLSHRLADLLQGARFHVSITHDGPVAAAVVVVEEADA